MTFKTRAFTSKNMTESEFIESNPECKFGFNSLFQNKARMVVTAADASGRRNTNSGFLHEKGKSFLVKGVLKKLSPKGVSYYYLKLLCLNNMQLCFYVLGPRPAKKLAFANCPLRLVE